MSWILFSLSIKIWFCLNQTLVQTFTHSLFNLMDPSFFINLPGHVWRTLSDIFGILSIPEIFHHNVITLTSLLVTLVTWYCVPWLHVKQTWNGVDKCNQISFFPPLFFPDDIEWYLDKCKDLENKISYICLKRKFSLKSHPTMTNIRFNFQNICTIKSYATFLDLPTLEVGPINWPMSVRPSFWQSIRLYDVF